MQQIYTTRGTTPLQNFQYAYDSNANITAIHDYIMGSPQTQTFGYDNLDRLTSAGASGGTQGNYTPESYTYDAATGNLATKGSATYNYGPQSAECSLPGLDKAHAAVSAGSSKFYCYDQNGNMVRRKIDNVIYTLTYDAENHMTGYSGGGVSAGFVYDGDGRRVQSTVNGVTTQFVGSHVEWKTSTTDMLRYYYAGGVRVAMRTGDAGLVWLVGDHLGSTSIAVTDSSGATERQGYKAWGETRFGSMSTKYQYTGQRSEPEIGLYYYGARWYDSDLARFSQADTIIPEASQGTIAWDRYAGMNNNSVKYSDPSGHMAERDGSMDSFSTFSTTTYPDGSKKVCSMSGECWIIPAPAPTPIPTQTPSSSSTWPTWNNRSWNSTPITQGKAYVPFQAPSDSHDSKSLPTTLNYPLNSGQQNVINQYSAPAAVISNVAPIALNTQLNNTPVNYVIYVQYAPYGTFPLNGVTVIAVTVTNSSAYPIVIGQVNIVASNQPSLLPCQQCNNVSILSNSPITVQPNNGAYISVGGNFPGQCSVVVVVIFQRAPLTGSQFFFTATYTLQGR